MNAANKTIGEIVAEDYRTSEVFAQHGIDFCCGGKDVLSTLCKEKGFDLATITSELEEVKSRQIEQEQNFSSWELPFLIDYIVNVHHGYLKENCAPIKAYTQKIAEVHGAKHPEVIEIASIFSKIIDNLLVHLQEEEEDFFPALKRADADRKTGTAQGVKDIAMIRESLKNLTADHEEIGEAMHSIRHLAKGYALPEQVCNTFVVTYRKLEEFEADLHKHVHLENNILFPKAVHLT